MDREDRDKTRRRGRPKPPLVIRKEFPRRVAWQRIGTGVILILGVFLLGTAIWLTLPSRLPQQTDETAPTELGPNTEPAPISKPQDPRQKKRARILLLFAWTVLLLLMLILVFGILLIVRWGRRLRNLPPRREATEVIDAWRQHRLPENEPKDDR